MAKKKSAGKKASAPEPAPVTKAAPKMHERKPKKSELELLERSRHLVAVYLERRDGLDPQVAIDVVEGMSADDVNELLTEANTSTIEKTKETMSHPPSETAEKIVGAVLGEGAKTEEDEGPVPDFVEFPDLVSNEAFPELVESCGMAARTKNAAEKEYKGKKKQIMDILKPMGIDKVSVMGIKLAVYTGHSTKLSAQKLMEKGVDPIIIKDCWEDTPYDDVRVTMPKEAQ